MGRDAYGVKRGRRQRLGRVGSNREASLAVEAAKEWAHAWQDADPRRGVLDRERCSELVRGDCEPARRDTQRGAVQVGELALGEAAAVSAEGLLVCRTPATLGVDEEPVAVEDDRSRPGRRSQ